MKKTLLIIIALIAGKYCFAQSYWERAASFAGNSTSYISVPNSPSVDITGSFMIEAWINPTSSGSSKGIIAKGGLLGTSMRFGVRLFSGKLTVMTNGAPRLTTKSSITANQWTHFAVGYDSSNSTFSFLINGVFDTSAFVPSAEPLPNTDSLFIGISGSSTPFSGKIDELRIWKGTISPFLSLAISNSTFATGGTNLTNLVLTMPFENRSGSSPFFSAEDLSSYGNHGNARNVSGFDLSDRPLANLLINDCADFSLSPGYFSAADNPVFSPTNKLTIELWVYMRSTEGGLVYKGPYFTFLPDYCLRIIDRKLAGFINSTGISTNDTIPLFKWTHVAFTYFGTTGRYEFFINGKRTTTGSITPGNINNSTDSLLFGSVISSPFNGFLDELRITHGIKSINEINNSMFTTINETNDDDAFSNAVYNFDGSTWSSTDDAPMLIIRSGNAFNYGGFLTQHMQSPVNGLTNQDFQEGYYLRNPNKRIPLSGPSGVTRDTLEILSSKSISDLNIYVALNHSKEQNLRIQLTSPIGSSMEFFSNYSQLDSSNSIVTVFDADADSLIGSGKYISFSPKIRPEVNPDAVFNGISTKGKWILSVFDDAGSDTGHITAWGLQFNDDENVPFTIDARAIVQGFYNPAANTMVPDTLRFYLRSIDFPFPVIDSSKALASSTGNVFAEFQNAQVMTNYFLVMKHRNSIESWSSSVIQFSQFTNQTSYNFTDLASKTFGDNAVQVDASPLTFAAYSGDQNQDGFVNLSDNVNVFNSASAFATGYLSTDMNGDNITNLNDIVLTNNNSSLFIQKITP